LTLLLIVALAVGYIVLRNPGLLTGAQSLAGQAQNALQPPSPGEGYQWTWHPQPGQPGYVQVNGGPAPAGFDAGNMSSAQMAGGFAQQGISIAESIASKLAVSLPGAIPLVGAAIGVVTSVIGMISAHHQQMVAEEAALLNKAYPAILQRFVLILQSTVRGAAGEPNEVTSAQQAEPMIAEAVTDYYNTVAPMKQGSWPDGGPGGWPTTPGNVITKYKPHNCNGPCEVGHEVEMMANAVRQAVPLILSGGSWSNTEPAGRTAGNVTPWPVGLYLVNGHGTIWFYLMPAHAGFAGGPEVAVTL